jgi:hypothetical protein
VPGGRRDVGPVPPALFASVADALRAAKSLPLTMAVANRLRKFQEDARQKYPTLAKSGFVAGGPALTEADEKAVDTSSREAIKPEFVANVPTIVSP